MSSIIEKRRTSWRHNKGRWTDEEKKIFLEALLVHGRGRWKLISRTLTTRTLVQIKSHAQKIIERMDAGHDVFAVLNKSQKDIPAIVKEKKRLSRPRSIDIKTARILLSLMQSPYIDRNTQLY